jgi:hypothetical protein
MGARQTTALGRRPACFTAAGLVLRSGMTELLRDSQVVTLDRDDFAAVRRNGRDFIPVIAPPARKL